MHTSIGIHHGRTRIEAQAGRVALDGIVVLAGGVAVVSSLTLGVGRHLLRAWVRTTFVI